MKKSIEDALKTRTLTDLVRECAQVLGGFTVDDIDAELVFRYGLISSGYRRRINSVIADLSRRRIIQSVKPAQLVAQRGKIGGTWKYIGKKKQRKKTDVIWHLIRSGRRVTFPELVRLSGASKSTVREYLRYLVNAGRIRRVKLGNYLLINDTGPEAPVNVEKKDRAKKRGKNKRSKVGSRRSDG